MSEKERNDFVMFMYHNKTRCRPMTDGRDLRADSLEVCKESGLKSNHENSMHQTRAKKEGPSSPNVICVNRGPGGS